jgi:hypothetical protein
LLAGETVLPEALDANYVRRSDAELFSLPKQLLMRENFDPMVRIRPATAADLAAMMRIEGESATAAHWAEDDYRRSIEAAEPPRVALVADVEAKTVGFLVAAGALPGERIPRNRRPAGLLS